MKWSDYPKGANVAESPNIILRELELNHSSYNVNRTEQNCLA